MKKTFGIIFLILGLIMIVAGIAALTNSSTRNNSYEGKVQNEFSENYRSNNSQQQAGGGTLFVVGLVFFVLGIVMVATKTKKQRLKEAELIILKNMQSTTPTIQPIQSNLNSNSIDELSKQAINFYKQKDYISAIAVTQRVLAIDPTNNQNHFNLACLYSITNNQEAFNSLSKAIDFGYLKFDKINTEEDLQWLRNQPAFNGFLKNGYKLNEPELEILKNEQPTTSSVQPIQSNSNSNSIDELTIKEIKKYYLHNGIEQQGPFDIDELKNKDIKKDTPIWFDGLPDWTTAENVDEIKELIKTSTPPPFKTSNKL